MSPLSAEAYKHLALCKETALAMQELRQGINSALLDAWGDIPEDRKPCSSELNIAPEIIRGIVEDDECSCLRSRGLNCSRHFRNGN